MKCQVDRLMWKPVFLFVACCMVVLYGHAQADPVLLRINNKDVTRSEFEYVYNKNNSLALSDKKNVREFLPLFINYKLKVVEAEGFGLDTTRAFREELNGYRELLARNFIMDRLIAEDTLRQIYARSNTTFRPGRIQVMHIYKKLPQNIPAFQEGRAKLLMDSLYMQLSANPQVDFAEYVECYSDDKQKRWIDWLETSKEFEDVAFSLQKGGMSLPFFTPQGIHIVKVFDKEEPRPYEEMREEAKGRLIKRYEKSEEAQVFLKKLKSEYHYISIDPNIKELFATGKSDGVLFTVGGNAYTGAQFQKFAQGNPLGTKKQFDAYVAKVLLDCENNHLEQKYPDFRFLMQEYRNGMLLFDISSREVWGKASFDKAGLEAYFVTHKKNYNWEHPHFKGIVLHCSDKKLVRQAKKLLKKKPFEEWKGIIEQNFNADGVRRIETEQGIFALGDNSFVDKLAFKEGAFTPPVSYPFTEIIGEKIKGPESYKEVLGVLVADYQNYLEEEWLSRLRGMCKVEINEEVIKTVNNH